MSSLALTSFVQIATAVVRLLGYSYAVSRLGLYSENSRLLLVIGYLPFLALFDVMVQSYSRAKYMARVKPLRGPPKLRIIFSLGSLCVLGVGAVVAGDGNTKAYSWLVVGVYACGGFGYFWERFSAANKRPAFQSLLELAIILLGVVAYHSDGNMSASAGLLALVSFPLARLIVLAFPGDDPVPLDGKKHESAHIGSYILFSMTQQIVGALSASLPSVYGTLTGDHVSLARNLITFRLIHSAAALASMVVNALGSRMFYSNIGPGFENLERRFMNFEIAARNFVLGVGILSLMAAPWVPVTTLAICGMAVFILIVLNLLSSLLMNRGLPGLALQSQTLVLVISIGLIFLITGNAAIFGVNMCFVLLVFPKYNKYAFASYRDRLP